MNIKETEKTTGMPRASIRFYESEGLIQPGRNENGYRNYTDDDIKKLKKIKLLRLLEMSIADIKTGMQDTEKFADAMDDHLKKLEETKTKLALSEQICQELSQKNTSFENLDADLYLAVMESKMDQDEMKTVLRADCNDPDEKAWRRCFARWIDGCLYSMALGTLLSGGFELDYGRWLQSWCRVWPAHVILYALIYVGLMLAIEPILLASFGTTLGKFILRIRVHYEDGRHLTYLEGLKRTWLVMVYGVGLEIPVYNLYRNYRSYRDLDAGKALKWEEETHSQAEVLPMKRACAFVFIFVAIALIIADTCLNP